MSPYLHPHSQSHLTTDRRLIILLVITNMDKPKELARILKVLSSDTRVRIIQLLKGETLCVNALAARLHLTQGAVSQHLRVMRDAGLVVDEKCGYFVHYCLNVQTLAEWREAIDGLLESLSEKDLEKKGGRPCAAATRQKAAARSQRT